MKHMGRTHKVSTRWLHEVLTGSKNVDLRYCESHDMRADLFTKAFTNPERWSHAVRSVGIRGVGLSTKPIPPKPKKKAKENAASEDGKQKASEKGKAATTEKGGGRPHVHANPKRR